MMMRVEVSAANSWQCVRGGPRGASAGMSGTDRGVGQNSTDARVCA